MQASKLQKQAEKLNRHLKVAHQTAAEAEVVHANTVAQHVKQLEDKEVSVHPLSGNTYLCAAVALSVCGAVPPLRPRCMHGMVVCTVYCMYILCCPQWQGAKPWHKLFKQLRYVQAMQLTTCLCQRELETQVDGTTLSGRGQDT